MVDGLADDRTSGVDPVGVYSLSPETGRESRYSRNR
jgi:hypothetical protein